MKGFITLSLFCLVSVGTVSAWDSYYKAPRHFQTGNWVYFQPALTARSAPFNFYEKPRVKVARSCRDNQKRRRVRNYSRRVVYRPYDRNCCREYRRHRRNDSCWH